jgi:hypothetical protein
MHKDNVFKRKGDNIFRVVEIKNLKIENYIHPDYEIKTESLGKLGETGLVLVFQIISILDDKEPYFIARWDQNFETLDIDIKNVDNNIQALFNAEKDGYVGHHPVRILKETRTYDVDIQLPGKSIFRGNVTFNLAHGHHPDLFR